MTQTGQYITGLDNGGLDYSTQKKELWGIASKQFAENASGDVNVFID
jgi:hypothetical protein